MFPIWAAFLILGYIHPEAISADSIFVGFSIVTAAFIISWQIYAQGVLNRKDKK